MATETGVLDVSYNFPSDDIPTEEKDSKWHMQYLSAMYREGTTRTNSKIFYSGRDEWNLFKEYALSKQSVLPYRKWLTGSDSQDKSWVNINWRIPTIGSKYRNILVNKLLAREFNIVCTPIDPLAVDKTAQWYADLKAKMMMGKIANKINPELLQTAALAKRSGDPEDMEDFEMRNQLGFKTKMAMDAELGVQVVFDQGKIREERRMVVEDFVDWGVGLYKDWVDENDEVRFRRVDGLAYICSNCDRRDFKDMMWGAEMVYTSLGELAPYFTIAQLKTIAEKVVGKNGNPRSVPTNFGQADCHKFKVLVLDGEWLSYNTEYWKRSYTSNGNYGIRRKRPDKRDGNAYIEVNGEAKPKYLKNGYRCVYKGKWIVDTEFIYDYGEATDQKRKKSQWRKTCLSYHAYAPDFYKMNALGIMERMVPFIDKYCEIYFKIQNFLNRWIPYIISIDMAALENIPLGKGGKKLTPMEVLDMLVQTNILVTRRKSAITGNPEQNDPVHVEATQMAQEITVLTQELQNTVQGLRDVTGLNEVVDGTGPADRTNVTAQEQAMQGSNNAINHFVTGDSALLEELAESVLMRLQLVIKRKAVSGYVQSLGSNYVKFVQVSPDISLHEYGIKLEDRPETQLKQQLIQILALKDQNGMINPEDYFMIMNMTNLKEIELKLIYSTKKRTEQQQQMAQANNAQQAQVNSQAAMQMEAAKQQTMALEYKLKTELENTKGAWMVEAAKAKGGMQLDQSALGAIKEIMMQVWQHDHEKGLAGTTGAGSPPAGPESGQPQAAPEQGSPLPASLQE